MGEMTNIEWTDSTWNPIYGCSEVSPGCDHCYARREMARFGKPWEVTRAAKATFYAPLHWPRGRRIFVCSWGDLFHPLVPEEWLQEIWDIMLATPQHTYQVLTKRPGRMAWWASRHGWPDHIWAGVSVESAKYLPHLDVLGWVPAKVRFVNCEPLLGPLDLAHISLGHDQLHWIIVGGESGPQARPMHPDWARAIRDQCQAAGVPFFFKQWGEWRPLELDDFYEDEKHPWGELRHNRPTAQVDGIPRSYQTSAGPGTITDRITMLRVGKKVAGDLLDGREWKEMPA